MISPSPNSAHSYDSLQVGAEDIESAAREPSNDAKIGVHKAKQIKKTKTSKRTAVLAILLTVIGVIVTLYPVFATLIMNQSQITAVNNVKKAAKNYSPHKRDEMLKAAQEYNKKLKSGPILDPFLERVAPNTKIYREYLGIIPLPDGLIGSVSIPKIHTTLPIYHGTYDEELDRGAGHLFGSSFPVGGKDTHAVITAHSGLGNATMFDYLPRLEKGDLITINVLDKTLVYRVTGKEVVVPTNTKSLYVQPGKDLITLVTCFPYGINTHRLLVHAERITGPAAKAAPETTTYIWRSWMILPIILCIVALIAVWWLIKMVPKRKNLRRTETNREEPPTP